MIIILDGISKRRGDYIMEKMDQVYDVAIVGGGLAGLSSAAYLAKHGKKVLLLERGTLGGRAVTLKLKDFSFNFGAHAIYGRDTSVLRQFEKEIGINIEWKDFQPHKAKYDLGDDLTDVPANVSGLFRTKVIKGRDKLKFTFEIFKTLIRAEKGHPHMTIKKWMEEQKISKDVAEMMLILASSNFFTNEPEKIRSDVFFDYYSRLFSTHKPVAYIGGGWQALIDEFVRVIEENGGTIVTKAKVDQVIMDQDRMVQVHTSKDSYRADDFIFCMAPKEIAKMVQGTKIEHSINQYATYEPSYVFVYDVGLAQRIDVPYSYIYDRQHKMFITDISYYDESCVPKGGQMLQAIAYMKQEEIGDKEVTERYQKQIEALYDKHFSGWRDHLVVPRISKRAVAQEIKWVIHQNPMPIYFPEYRNLFFAGDWCQGKGQLSELSFSSALDCCQVILKK